MRGFEPPTPWSQTKYSTRLSYTPNDRHYNTIFSKCKYFVWLFIHLNGLGKNGNILYDKERGDFMPNVKKPSKKPVQKKAVRATRVKRAPRAKATPRDPVMAAINRMYIKSFVVCCRGRNFIL